MTDLQGTVFITILLWSLIGVFIESLVADYLDDCHFVCTPKMVYDNTRMNWFGSIFCFLIIRFISIGATVAGLIICIVVYICALIEWLFTVGRDDGSEEE